MTLVGDSKAYVFLAKHGPLIHELPNRAVILTVEGRVWVITFLFFHDYLTKENFNQIALQLEQQQHPELAAYATGKFIGEACRKWLNNHDKEIRREGTDYVYPTDLTAVQIAVLINLLVAGQENLERVAEGKPVQ